MKHLKLISAGLLLAVASVSGSAFAYHGGGGYHGGGYHGGGARVGVYFGGPVLGLGFPYYGYPGNYGYAYGPYGYYGQSTTIVTQAQPSVYVEQAPQGSYSSSGPASDGYWYYCHRPDGYYPYVKECADGWQKVSPQPSQR